MNRIRFFAIGAALCAAVVIVATAGDAQAGWLFNRCCGWDSGCGCSSCGSCNTCGSSSCNTCGTSSCTTYNAPACNSCGYSYYRGCSSCGYGYYTYRGCSSCGSTAQAAPAMPPPAPMQSPSNAVSVIAPR